MPTRFIQRRSALAPGDVSLPNANAIFVDSDDDQLKYTTGTSGTTTVDIVTESQTQTLTNKTLTSPTITTPTITAPILSTRGVTNVTTGNLTLTAAAHGGGIITMNDSDAGNVLTLPDASGSGVTFEIVIGTTVATGTVAVKAPDTDNVFVGFAHMTVDSDSETDSPLIFRTVATDDTITLNGSTQGGLKGDYIRFVDIAADTWLVQAFLSGTGSEVTPFSATVS